MSATRPSSRRTAETQVGPERRAPRGISQLHARRREANRRRRLFRLDIGLGVLLAIVLLLATPGLAIAAILAGALVLGCAVSVVIQRRRRRAQGAQRGSRTKTAMSRDVRSS
jgi:Flp pilus assembly protein TadB